MNFTALDIQYPESEKKLFSNTYFNETITDPFQWLEDDNSPETENWVKNQNKVTFNYLNNIPFRQKLRNELAHVWDYEKQSLPFFEGSKVYYFKNTGLQNQSVLYQCHNLISGPDISRVTDNERVFLDPNKFSQDGTVSLGSIEFSENGHLAAYSVSNGGSDWQDVYVIDTNSLQLLSDRVTNVKFSQLCWYKNDGFFYSAYEVPSQSRLYGKTDRHKIFYHKIGTDQKDDKLIFGGMEYDKRRYVSAFVTDDSRYLVIYCSESTSGNEIYIADLQKSSLSEGRLWLKLIKGDFESDNYVICNRGSIFYIVTNHNAPNNKIVTLDFKASDCSYLTWSDFITEQSCVLRPMVCGTNIYCHYLKDAVSYIKQYDFSGNFIKDIDLPGQGSVHGFNGKIDQKRVFYFFTNYITPGNIYEYFPETGESKIFWKSPFKTDLSDFISEQVFYTSFDGTKIPMTISYKKGLNMNGDNPTILYGYGGFNISLVPGFSVAMSVWIKNGGIYAVPNIRGGGEYGKTWHNKGTGLNKKNVFKDFISAAEYLFEKKYTSSKHLALKGGSNGGLLVGAVMTMRPDIARVALLAVGVLDMLRYHLFTSGAGWAYDYGTADDSEEMFKYLLSYSPLHNIKKNVELPSVLITTGDHDDRVVPAHSFKFAARLQNDNISNSPKLIRIETRAGHGAGTPVSKLIDLNADIFAFTFYNMGISVLIK